MERGKRDPFKWLAGGFALDEIQRIRGENRGGAGMDGGKESKSRAASVHREKTILGRERRNHKL